VRRTVTVTFANGRRRVLAGRRWVRDRDGVGGRAALRSKGLGALVVLSVVFGGVTAIEPARAETPEERALAEARAKLTEVRAEIEDAERVAEDASDALEDADATLREIEQVVNETTEAVERQRKVTQRAQDRLEALEDERDELIRAFNQRAVRAFKLGPTSALDVLFGGDGASDAIDRTTYLRSVLDGDQVDLESIDAAEVAVDAERERAEAEELRLTTLLEEREEVLVEVEELRQTRALEAADARERVRMLEEERDDLESEQERIEELIAEREAEERRRAAAEREAQRQAQQRAQQQQAEAPRSQQQTSSSSGYSWPLCAPVTSEYGPRWGRMHRGIDLGAPTGTPIGAARAGQVIFANWQGGYGRLVLIRHDDGVVTAYAHMSSFAVSEGQRVDRGQRIGNVGSTGNSTGPHLHLEFRVGGQAQNPRQYLSGSPC
jgi:murein DD-endopeptidase MepM/ murein hydrolase activator NlpD